MSLYLFRQALLLAVLALLSACAQQQFYWGSYEDSLYYRYQHPGEQGEAQAFSMLVATINEAEQIKAKVAPGVYADYGYLLFKQGKADEAITAFQKEAQLFPESTQLMETMVERIQARQMHEKKRSP